MAVSLTITRSTTLFNDQDGDGVFDPGDVLLTKIRINHAPASDTAATGVQVTDTLNGVTLVPGSIQVTPIAFDDGYALTGNTPITIGAGAGLLANDIDPDSATPFSNVGVTVSSVDTTGTSGSVAFNADGSFTFTPTTGFVGVTSFKYYVNDAQGLGNVTEGIVTMTVTGKVWYVDNTYGGENGASDGSYLKPFTQLTQLNGANGDGSTGDDVDGTGDTIFMYHNGSAYTAGITLEAGQKLYGDGQSLLVNGHNIGGAERTGGADVATNAVIDNAGANGGITLSTDNEVKGLTINGTANGAIGIQDGNGSVTTAGGTLVIDTVSLTGTGKALDIDQGGNLNVDIDVLSSAGSTTEGVHLSGVTGSALTGTFNAADGHVQTSTGVGFLVGQSGGGTATSGGAVNIGYGGDLSNNGGANIEIQDRTGGTVAFGSTSTLTDSSGQGIVVDGVTGTVNFSGQISISSGTSTAVQLTNNSGGTINFAPTGNGLDLTTTSGTGLIFTGGGTLSITGTDNSIGTATGTMVNAANGLVGAAGINFGALSASGAVAGDAVHIDNLDNNAVTIASLSLTGGAGGDGIDISNSNAAFTFANAVTITNAARGVILDNNDGGSVTFQGNGNGVDITGSGAAFAAVNGGTVTVQGSGNTLNATNATALNVSDTFIGLNGLTFTSISAGNATNGIILSNTGTTAGVHGGLTVTGDGTALLNNSGGVIQNTSGNGVHLSSTRAVNLDQMQVTAAGGSGVYGSDVTNFTLTRSNLTNNGNSNAGGIEEGNVRFDNLLGSATIDANAISGGFTENVRVMNTSGTLDRLNVTNNTFGTINAAGGNDNIHFEVTNSGVMKLNVDNNTFAGTRGDFVEAIANLNSTLEVAVRTNDMNNGQAIIPGGGVGVSIRSGSGGNVSAANTKFEITNNLINDGGVNAFDTVGIFVAKGQDNGTLQGTIQGNTLVAKTGSNSDGIFVRSAGGGTTTTLIQNNTISNWGFAGIHLQNNDGSGTMNASVFGNTVNVSPAAFPFAALYADNGATATDTSKMNLVLGSSSNVAQQNTFAAGVGAVTDVSLSNFGGSTLFNLSRNGSAGATPAAVVQDDNVGSPGVDTTGGAGTITLVNTLPPTPAALAFMTVDPMAGGGEQVPVDAGLENQPVVVVTDPAGTPGDSGTPPAPPPAPVFVDDGIVSQAELNGLVEEAIQRWTAAGATADQIAAMRATTIRVSEMAGLYVGASSAGQILIDSDGAGIGWFVDSTPGDDNEFAGAGSALGAIAGGGADGRIDLLTVLMHELGHQIGLTDTYGTHDADDLMYGYADRGERRLPGQGEAYGAIQGTVANTAFALTPVSVGTLPDNKAVEVLFKSTVNTPPAGFITNPPNTSTVSGSNFADVTGNETLVIDSLTLGNRVFNDLNSSGGYDAGDSGIDNVAVSLYIDSNSNNVYDAGTDTFLATTTTAGGGLYSFAGLAPGDYIVVIGAANFGAGQPLDGLTSLVGGSDPDNNTDNDDNGIVLGSDVVSQAITLSYNSEPTAGSGNDTNDTLDFGFTAGNPPAGGDETRTIQEDGRHNFAASEFHFTDTDGDSFASVVVTTLPTNGTLFLDTDGAGAGLPVAVTAGQEILVQYLDGRFYYVPGANENGTPHDSFTFQVRDSRSSNNLDLSANTFTFNVTAMNDAPVNAVGGPVSTSEDSVNVVLSDNVNPMSVSDVEATGDISYNLLVEHGTLTIRTDVVGGIQASDIQTGPGVGNGTGALVITATIAEINTTLAAANGLLYTPNGNYNGSDPLRVYANDAGQTGADPNPVSVLDPFVDPDIGPTTEEDVDTRPITITPVNDAPVLSSPTSATVTFTEGDTSVALLQGVTLSDVDLPANFAGGSLSLSVSGGAGSGGVNLRSGSNFHLVDLGGGNFSLVYQPGGTPFTIGSITGYGTPTMVITGLSSEATLARLNDLVDDFVYVIPGENPAAGSRTVTLTFNDGGNVGGGALSTFATQTLNVVAVNDAPVNTAPSSRAGTEDTNLVFSGVNAISVADVDAATLQVTLSVLHGTLTLSGTAGLSFGAGDGTGDTTMTFSGTIAAINAALNGLVYRGNLNYEGSDTLSVSTSDLGATGTGNVLTDNDSVAITLADDGYITGSNGDDVMTGTPNPDFFRLEQGGNDDVTGLASNDVFFFGAALTSADKVDGDGGIDQMGLQGDYSGANALTLGTGVLSIESLAILPGSDTRFGAPGTDLFSYDITAVDENVAAGVRMVIDANRLQAGEDFTFDGSAETDGSFFIYGAGGVDNLTGGAQNDIFLFGEQGQFGANDVVDGGPGGLDQLGLRGDYTITFGANQLINIVSFALVSAHDTRFASLGQDFDYDLTMDDGNVAAGVRLTVDGANLRATESLTFDGGAELDGTFRVFGGAGSDIIMGGEGADIIVGRGGADLVGGCNGADTFRYDAVSESSAAAPDMIMDFEHAIDNIDLRLIDANTLLGGNQAFHSIGSGAFSGAGAASAGELRFEDVGSNWLVEGDVNGDGTADLVIQVTMFGVDTLTASDFQF